MNSKRLDSLKNPTSTASAKSLQPEIPMIATDARTRKRLREPIAPVLSFNPRANRLLLDRLGKVDDIHTVPHCDLPGDRLGNDSDESVA